MQTAKLTAQGSQNQLHYIMMNSNNVFLLLLFCAFIVGRAIEITDPPLHKHRAYCNGWCQKNVTPVVSGSNLKIVALRQWNVGPLKGHLAEDETLLNGVTVRVLDEQDFVSQNRSVNQRTLELRNWTPRAFEKLKFRSFNNGSSEPEEFVIAGPIDEWTIYRINYTFQRTDVWKIQVVLPNSRFNLDIIKYENRGNDTNGTLWYFSSFRKRVLARTLGDMKVVLNSPEASLYWLNRHSNDSQSNYAYDHILSSKHVRNALIMNPNSPYEGQGSSRTFTLPFWPFVWERHSRWGKHFEVFWHQLGHTFGFRHGHYHLSTLNRDLSELSEYFNQICVFQHMTPSIEHYEDGIGLSAVTNRQAKLVYIFNGFGYRTFNFSNGTAGARAQVSRRWNVTGAKSVTLFMRPHLSTTETAVRFAWSTADRDGLLLVPYVRGDTPANWTIQVLPRTLPISQGSSNPVLQQFRWSGEPIDGEPPDVSRLVSTLRSGDKDTTLLQPHHLPGIGFFTGCRFCADRLATACSNLYTDPRWRFLRRLSGGPCDLELLLDGADGYAYFFKGERYIKYDLAEKTAVLKRTEHLLLSLFGEPAGKPAFRGKTALSLV